MNLHHGLQTNGKRAKGFEGSNALQQPADPQFSSQILDSCPFIIGGQLSQELVLCNLQCSQRNSDLPCHNVNNVDNIDDNGNEHD